MHKTTMMLGENADSQVIRTENLIWLIVFNSQTLHFLQVPKVVLMWWGPGALLEKHA